MFEDFTTKRLPANGVEIHTLIGGSGPPLLLLHGYPQSHLIWHRVASDLAKNYTIVATDLRGYGQSGKAVDTPNHASYSKREMARDQVEVMRQLGFESFFLCGHDRGGRVGHRLAIDHPQAVKKLMLLDISPTLTMYENTNMDFARSYWWWFWLIQPAPFPESMVAAAPETFLKKKIGWGYGGLKPFTEEAFAAYLSYISDPATMHAMCEDYRAAASIDLEHDRADRDAKRKIACDVRVLWGEHGVVNRCFKPIEDWRRVVADGCQADGHSLPCGHYLPEEEPALLLADMKQFFV